MASFILRSQRTGQYKEFSLIEILKLLGDQVNDEIWLEEDKEVYNISSFQEINGNGNGGHHGGDCLNWSVESPASLAGLNTFFLNYHPAGPLVLVILNGMVLNRNKDYSLDGRQISLPFLLNWQDSLQFIYPF